ASAAHFVPSPPSSTSARFPFRSHTLHAYPLPSADSFRTVRAMPPRLRESRPTERAVDDPAHGVQALAKSLCERVANRTWLPHRLRPDRGEEAALAGIVAMGRGRYEPTTSPIDGSRLPVSRARETACRPLRESFRDSHPPARGSPSPGTSIQKPLDIIHDGRH